VHDFLFLQPLYMYCLLLLVLCQAFSSNGADTRVYRNVKDYGAKGDGKTDDTGAIIAALTNVNSYIIPSHCFKGRGANPDAPYPQTEYPCSTQHPAFVFFPPGVYVVTQTLPLIFYTEMVGDAGNLPTIKFVSSSDADLRVLDAQGAWFPDVNQVSKFSFFAHSYPEQFLPLRSSLYC
jgi:hypothetical protein